VSDIRLYMLECGTIRVPLRNMNLYQGGGGEMVTNPTPWFLITHPRGNVVIDGGNAPEVAVDARRHWGRVTDMSTPVMTPDQAVLPTLERLGVDPGSIRWVVQSHLHLDHTGAVAVIDRLPNAQVLVNRTEHEFAHAPISFAEWGYCRADFVKPGIDWVILEDADDGYDLFGDGTLRCWRTPGHSPGHLSFEVHLPSGASLLLAVDAANNMEQWEERVLPGFALSTLDFVNSVRKLRRLAWRAQATVVPGHDPERWPSFRLAPAYYD